MSIVSEVKRLKDAKTAIQTAIEGKGVTVPDATMLEGMAALIDSIEAGGGSSDYIIETGTITFAESYKPYSTPLVINHNLSTVPCLFIASNGCKASFPKYQICYLLKASGLWSSYLRSKNSAILYSTNAGSDVMSMISGNYIQLSTSSITISGGSSAYDFNPSGTGTTSTLKWLAVAEKA